MLDCRVSVFFLGNFFFLFGFLHDARRAAGSGSGSGSGSRSGSGGLADEVATCKYRQESRRVEEDLVSVALVAFCAT